MRFYNKQMQKLILIFAVSYLHAVTVLAVPFSIDLDNNLNYFNISCIRENQIDFFFSENSYAQCSTESCLVKDIKQSFLAIFDKQLDKHWNLTLESFEYTNQTFVKSRSAQDGWRTFAFLFTDQSHKIYVLLPVLFSNFLDGRNQFIIHLDKLDVQSEYSYFNSFKNIETLHTIFSLSTFNFLNIRDFGLFYKVNDAEKNVTIMLSQLIYRPIFNYKDQAAPSTFSDESFDYQFAGKLCYGGELTENIFRTHLADNYPLWTGWVYIFFFWLYYLFTQKNNPKCFERKFQNNKWTSWSIYSLFHLGYDDFFSKMSRMTSIIICSSYQALVISIILYNMRIDYKSIVILWTIPVTIISSQPVSYLIGWIFLRRSYHMIIQKYQIVSRINHKRKHTDFISKEEQNEFLSELYASKQGIYQIYYVYYSFAIVVVLICWTVSVHLMQITYTGDSHLHPDWVISFVVTFVIDIFVLQVILTYFLGDKQFFQMRGFYYQYSLGEGHSNSLKKIK